MSKNTHQKIDFILDLSQAKPNQNVILETTGSGLTVVLKQDKSTPGVLFQKIELPQGAYELNIVYTSQAHNTFNINFFDNELKEKKIRISKKLPMGSGDFSAKFTVAEQQVYIPSILASLGKIDDSISIQSFTITKENQNTSQDPLLQEQSTEEPPKHTSTSNTSPGLNDNSADISVQQGAIYFLNTGNKHGLGTFLRQLKILLPDMIILENTDAAEQVLSKGVKVLTNGFTKSTEILAYRFNGQLVCFWHSSFAGSDLMGESGRLINFLTAIQNKIVQAFFLNPTEPLPIGAKRFWLPFTLSPKSDTSKTIPKYDFAMPLGSPHSLVCKNLLETIIFLLTSNYSFVMPRWYEQLFDLNTLKTAFGSTSDFAFFETQANPIEDAYYQQAKFYLTLSHSDTMPYSCIEALNAKTPVIINKNVGWARFFDDKKDTFVLKNNKQIQSFFEENKDPTKRSQILERQIQVLSEVSKNNATQLKKQLGVH
jgi:hypothetical protein